VTVQTDPRERVDTVLVVGDTEMNRVLVAAPLGAAGYGVEHAESGLRALEIFAQRRPNVVLLDVLMPELDGFETCRRLRALQGGSDTAIIFLTALGDLGSHQEAMASGADDFLQKPVNRTELLLRVRSLLWIRRLREELHQGYDVIRGQRDALLAAHRQKEMLTQLVVHDLKNPISSIMTNAAYLHTLPGASEDGREAATDILESARAMHRMVLNLLDIGRSDDGVLVPRWDEVAVAALLEEVQLENRRRAAQRAQTLDLAVAPDLPPLRADRDLLRRLVENLLDNAFRATPPGGRIRIEAHPAPPDAVMLAVVDEGPGVPPDHRERIFDKYVRLAGANEPVRSNRGLGLTFCRMAAEAHGGRIWVEDAQPRGASFRVRLPLRADTPGVREAVA